MYEIKSARGLKSLKYPANTPANGPETHAQGGYF